MGGGLGMERGAAGLPETHRWNVHVDHIFNR